MKSAMILALCLGTASAAQAQGSGHGIDLGQGARELGLMVGAAYVCTPDERKPAARNEAESMFDMILYETGHEVAYLFAVSMGYGAGIEAEDIKCDAVLDYVGGIKQDMFTGGRK